MQYNYISCDLPSNGRFYPIKTVHIRPKTIFDIKVLLGNPIYYLKDEIDTLQNCIDPKDNINVYKLVKQDVVYLLYKLRSLSDDLLVINYRGKQYDCSISELEVKYLSSDINNIVKLPESQKTVTLKMPTLGDTFNIADDIIEFKKKYPDYNGDVENTVHILNSICSIDDFTETNFIRNVLEELSWKDSIFLIQEIERYQTNSDFGIVEFVTIQDEAGNDIKLPIEITEKFFRSAL